MAAESTFTIFIKTIANAAGFTDIKNAAQSSASTIEQVNERLRSSFETVKRGLEVLGVGLTIRELAEYGR